MQLQRHQKCTSKALSASVLVMTKQQHPRHTLCWTTPTACQCSCTRDQKCWQTPFSICVADDKATTPKTHTRAGQHLGLRLLLQKYQRCWQPPFQHALSAATMCQSPNTCCCAEQQPSLQCCCRDTQGVGNPPFSIFVGDNDVTTPNTYTVLDNTNCTATSVAFTQNLQALAVPCPPPGGAM